MLTWYCFVEAKFIYLLCSRLCNCVWRLSWSSLMGIQLSNQSWKHGIRKLTCPQALPFGQTASASLNDWWRMIVNLEASLASVMSRRWSLSSFDTCISRSEQNLLENNHSLWQIPILNSTQVSTCPSVYDINDMMVHKNCSTTLISKTFSLRSCMISIRYFRSHFTAGMWIVGLSISGDFKMLAIIWRHLLWRASSPWLGPTLDSSFGIWSQW